MLDVKLTKLNKFYYTLANEIFWNDVPLPLRSENDTDLFTSGNSRYIICVVETRLNGNIKI